MAAPWPWVAAVVVSYGLLFVLMFVLLLLPLLFAPPSGPTGGQIVALVLGMFVFMGAAQLPTVILLRGAADALDGRPVTVARMLDGRTILRSLGALAVVVVGVLVGYVLLIVPGIVFGFLAAFAVHHVVEDDLGPLDAVRASIRTVRGDWLHALAIVFVTSVLAGVGFYACGIGVVVSAPVAMIAQLHGFRRLTGRPVPAA